MKILVICHYFAPEPGAPSARWLEMTRSWVKAGHEVTVVTCFPNHPTGIIPEAYRGKLRTREIIDGVEVLRNWVYATPNEGVVKKTLSHISFMISSVLLSFRRAGNVDIVVVSSPTFFSMFSGYVFSRLKRVPLIIEVRDLWPAAIIELGVLKNRAIIRILEAMELFMYGAARHVVVVTESFRDNLVSRGIPADKVSVITNGVDPQLYSDGPKDPAIEQELGCKGKKLVLYIGAHGISQGLDSVLEAASLLRHRRDIVFGFVGEGAAKASLQARARELQLENVVFLPAQPKERMPLFYRTCDVGLVPLKKIPLFKTFIPSKMFEIMGCARPVVAALEGEAASILQRSGAAIVVPPEDAKRLSEAILEFIDDEPRRIAAGQAGAAFVRAHYSREELAKRYLTLLHQAVRGR